MKIKEYLEKNNLSLRKMAELCDVHYSTLYRLSLPKSHKSARKISLDVAQRIVKGTLGKVTLQDLTGN
ncbi:MAG: hypothetical protein RIQ94_177 [Pseudomonadota bacterium]|jgi:plasmid maintenance system antidote protein VapI